MRGWVVLIALWMFRHSILFSHWFYWCDAVLGMGGQRLLSHEDWFINQQISHTWIMIVQRIGFNGNGLRALSYFLCFWCQICVFLISKMKKRVQETWQALGRSWIQHRKRCTRCSSRLLNFLPSFGALATDCNTCQTDQLDGKGNLGNETIWTHFQMIGKRENVCTFQLKCILSKLFFQ